MIINFELLCSLKMFKIKIINTFVYAPNRINTYGPFYELCQNAQLIW